jgi:hypothetical protein
MAYNSVEDIVKKIVEKSFPAVGETLAYVRPNHYIEVNSPSADRADVDISRTGDGRKFFMVGFSDWEGGDIVAD